MRPEMFFAQLLFAATSYIPLFSGCQQDKVKAMYLQITIRTQNAIEKEKKRLI